MSLIEDVLATKTTKDLILEQPVVEQVLPELTTENIESAIKMLKNIEANNGYVGIAQKLSLTPTQVKEIHTAMLKKIADETIVKE